MVSPKINVIYLYKLMTSMNKTELCDTLAKRLQVTKAAANEFIDAFKDIVTESLSAGKAVSLTGFITLKPNDRKARTGRNPQTGASLQIPATKTVRMVVGVGLKNAVNHKKAKKSSKPSTKKK